MCHGVMIMLVAQRFDSYTCDIYLVLDYLYIILFNIQPFSIHPVLSP